MKRALPLLVALAGCPSTDVVIDAPPGPPDLTELSFGPLEPFDRPTDDYIDTNAEELGHDDFLQGLHDLHVFDDRLYVGYGDANLNLGQVTPIEVRAYSDDVAGGWGSEFIVDDEQIDRFVSSGDDLAIPGIDATEDAWLGNAYLRTVDDDWFKSRTLDQAIHVHDVAFDGATIHACGSGSTPEEYNAGNISSLVFRSDDLGATFQLVWKVPNSNPSGDARFTHLARLGGELHAFGYRSNGAQINELIAYRQGDVDPVPWTAMQDVLVQRIVDLGDGTALMAGVFAAGDLRQVNRRLGLDSSEDVLEGRGVIDLSPLGDGRALVLSIDDDRWPMPEGPWTVEIGVFDPSDGAYVGLTESEVEVLPSSIAFWRNALYVGDEAGALLRSAGE
jgi:hypothetical protein